MSSRWWQERLRPKFIFGTYFFISLINYNFIDAMIIKLSPNYLVKSKCQTLFMYLIYYNVVTDMYN